MAEVGEEGLIVLNFELEVSRTEVKGISNVELSLADSV